MQSTKSKPVSNANAPKTPTSRFGIVDLRVMVRARPRLSFVASAAASAMMRGWAAKPSAPMKVIVTLLSGSGPPLQ